MATLVLSLHRCDRQQSAISLSMLANVSVKTMVRGSHLCSVLPKINIPAKT
jgi:hypothetical protein